MEPTEAGNIRSVTAITEVFAEGQKIRALAVEYAEELEGPGLPASAFSVEGRGVVEAYASLGPEPGARADKGRYAIVELALGDPGAATIVPKAGSKFESIRKAPRAGVAQVGDLRRAGGGILAADRRRVYSGNELNLLADDFLELEFNPTGGGEALRYELFLPKGYDQARSYPLLLFVHDRGVCSAEYRLGLIQGLGGIVWARPEEQAKRECLVLVPQYPVAIVDDDFRAAAHLDLTLALVEDIASRYRVDRGRIYAAGQSMGCMAVLEMGIRRPGLFAAALLCAGQWNPATMPAWAGGKLWVLVSERDLRAFEGMNACMASLERAGAEVSRSVWDGGAGEAGLEALARAAAREGGGIKYTVFEGSSVVPPAEREGSALPEMFLNHMATWKIVYAIEALREWLFAQRKDA